MPRGQSRDSTSSSTSWWWLYNDKFAQPATAIMNELSQGQETDRRPPMDEKWSDYLNSGTTRGGRAAHGAPCPGGYAWWHGIYDVAKNFYTHFIPR